MHTTLTVIQLIFAVLMVVAVLLQARGASIGATFGGVGEAFQERRGIEKVLYRATIIFGFIFLFSGLGLVLW